MSEICGIVANIGEAGSELDAQEASGLASNQEMISSEIRHMQMADPQLALNLIANRHPGRVLDLLEMGSVGIA